MATSPCHNQMHVCGFSEGVQNNWLITQYINRQLSSGLSVNHVNVELDMELNECSRTELCSQSIEVYKWETSTVNATLATNTTNYDRVGEISSPFNSSTVRFNGTAQIELTSERSGFYLAFVDVGTCITIYHVLVSYNVCLSGIEDLVLLPETLAPTAELSGQCIDNSSTAGGMDPVIRCSNEGRWEVELGCLCNPGYEGVMNASTVIGCSGVCARIDTSTHSTE